MNRVFNLIWSNKKERWIVVSEKVKGNGRVPSSQLRTIAALAAMLSSGGPAYALDPGSLPSGGKITSGSATIATTGTQMTVNQSSQQMIANWTSFNIGQDAAVRFNQPNFSASALNRITDQNPTQIMGSLTSNGQVFLLNPSGIIFGKTATVNVGSLVASSLNMLDADFLSGKYILSNAGNAGSILNQGAIKAIDGGVVALIAPKVTNEGSIIANSGSSLLAAGNQVSLDFTGDGLISYTVDQGAVDALVENKGLIKADGGVVVMTAKAADALRTATVTNSGVIEARTIEHRAGHILLLSDMENGVTNVTGTLDASAPNAGDGGFVETSGGQVKIGDGTVVTTTASQGKSGTWLIDPTNFSINSGSALLSKSGIGASTLNKALVKGNVSITTSSLGSASGDIFVNAPVSWTANKLTLTAHHDININAVMTAIGTATLALNYGWNGNILSPTYGTSGNINMSIKQDGTFTGRIDFLMSNGTTPRSGTDFLTINSLPFTVINDATTLQSLPLTGNYALGSSFSWSTSSVFTPIGAYGTPFSGTFDGLGHTISKLSISQNAHNVGLFGINDPGSIIRNVSLNEAIVSGVAPGVYNVGGLIGANYGSISNCSIIGGFVDGISNVGGLAGLNEGSSNKTANISGCIVSGVRLNSNNNNDNNNAGGLVGQNYGYYGTANVSNCSVSGGSVSGGQFVGGLVGQNNAMHGTANINACSVTNTNVIGIFYSDSNYGNAAWSVGGLVGWNRAYYGAANINKSLVSGSIVSTMDNGIYTGWVGGLVGTNNGGVSATANISGCSVTGGSVSGNSYVGGLVGWNTVGTVTNSFVTGVRVSGISNVGGLVGVNYGVITGSFVKGGSVSGSSNVGGLIGYNLNGSISSSSVSSVNVKGGSNVGGLIGQNYGDYGIANISGSSVTGGSVRGSSNVGGLVGLNHAISGTANIGSSSVSGGSVSGSSNVGGLVGINDSTINESYSTDSVSGGNNIGGLVGANSGSITNAYETGRVSGSSNVGGLVGANSGTITYTYETGRVSGRSKVGGLVGTNNGIIFHSFYNNTVNPTLTGVANIRDATGHVEGKSTLNLQNIRTFTGWNISENRRLSAGPPVLGFSTNAATIWIIH